MFSKIKTSSGPVFVYSNFKDFGGLKSLIVFLEYHGFKSFKLNGEGKRYAVWSGSEHNNTKEAIKATFNNKKMLMVQKLKYY